MENSKSDGPISAEEWTTYKRGKAVAFVELGYNVEWTPAENHWISVCLPGCPFDGTPEIRATAKFYMGPSKYGIDKGRVSKLEIRETTFSLADRLLDRRSADSNIAYAFDRGLDRDYLAEFPASRRLYVDIMELIN